MEAGREDLSLKTRMPPSGAAYDYAWGLHPLIFSLPTYD